MTIGDRIRELTQSFKYLPRGLEPFDVQRLVLPEDVLSRNTARRTMARLTRCQRQLVRDLRSSRVARAVMSELLNATYREVSSET